MRRITWLRSDAHLTAAQRVANGCAAHPTHPFILFASLANKRLKFELDKRKIANPTHRFFE